MLRALERMGYKFVPDTTSEAFHELSVADNAGLVRSTVPALVAAFGGSPALAAQVDEWMGS